MKNYTLFLFAFAILLLAACGTATAGGPENTIYADLTTKGVPLADGKKASLPKFTMDDGLTGQAQDTVINNLLAANPNNAPPLAKFMGNKVTAPYYRVDTNIPDSTSHQLDLYFIAFGKLKTVADGNFWKARMGANKNGEMKFLPTSEVQKRHLKETDKPDLKQRYADAKVDLFGMVKVSGTAEAMETIGTESVVIAFLLDPSFLKDKDFPNDWRPIKFDPNGKAIIGDPEPYDGVGAYSKVTELQNTPGALFVEYHIIWDEPQGWFGGKPVMKSKLGDMINSDVRSFRNDLKLGVANTPPANQPAAAAPATTQPAAPAAPPKSNEAKSSK